MSNVSQPIQDPNAIMQPTGEGQPQKKSFVPSDFVFGKTLGQGRFGTVFLGREKKNSFTVAINRADKGMFNTPKTMLQMKREVELHYHLPHKNILNLFGFFHDLDYVYILFEACQLGSLFKVLRDNKCLSVHRATYVIDCMADALNYCHARHVIHRDIKPENILLTEQFEPKLADFGWAVHANDLNRTFYGTSDYIAPERLNFFQYDSHTFKIDSWAIGVLYYECLTGQTPFYNKDQTLTLRNIQHARIQPHAKIPEDAMKVIKGLLTIEVDKRSELNDVRSDQFVRDQVEKYNSNMSARRAANEIKPENILLTGQLEPKLADFGLAVQTLDTSRTICGTPDYISPEMLNFHQNHGHTFKIDNWAIGVLYYECLTGQTPFYNKDQTMTFRNIRHARIQPHAKIPEGAMKVIKGLLTIEVEKRSELNDVRNDQFVRDEVEKYNSIRVARHALRNADAAAGKAEEAEEKKENTDDGDK